MNELIDDMSLNEEETEPKQEENRPVSEEIKDMSLEDSEEEKTRKQEEGKKKLEDMTNLEAKSISYSNLQDRIDKLYSASREYIYITPDIIIQRTSGGGYFLLPQNTDFKSLGKTDLTMIDKFLKSEEGK